MFTSRKATRIVRRYLKKGLSGTARDLAEAIAAGGVENSTVLEVGRGVGILGVDLIRRGGSRALVVDLSPSWESAAAGLTRTLGLNGRIERRLGDAVEVTAELEPFDVVVAHAVVCCYPDWRRLLGVMSYAAQRRLGLTLPADRWNTRLMVRSVNTWLALIRRRFRTFVHPVSEIINQSISAGFHVVFDRV